MKASWTTVVVAVVVVAGVLPLMAAEPDSYTGTTPPSDDLIVKTCNKERTDGGRCTGVLGKAKVSDTTYHVYYSELVSGATKATWSGWRGDMKLVHLDTGIWILSREPGISVTGWAGIVEKAEGKSGD